MNCASCVCFYCGLGKGNPSDACLWLTARRKMSSPFFFLSFFTVEILVKYKVEGKKRYLKARWTQMYFKPSRIAHFKEFLVFFLSWWRKQCQSHPLFRKINVLSEHANSCSRQPHAEWHFQAGAEARAPALWTFEREMDSPLPPGKRQSNY